MFRYFQSPEVCVNGARKRGFALSTAELGRGGPAKGLGLVTAMGDRLQAPVASPGWHDNPDPA